MHSPVWHAYDVTYDTTEVWTEWEYCTDEFFDDLGQSTRERKRRKMKHLEEAPVPVALQDGEADGPTQWTPTDSDGKGPRDVPGVPVFDEIEQEKVALLKDWRERFKGILPEERTSATKGLGLIASGQLQGSEKRRPEDSSNVAGPARIETLSANTQTYTKVSARSSRTPGSSKLRNEIIRGRQPVSPPKSHTEDLSAENSTSQPRKRLKHGGSQSTSFETKSNAGSITAPKRKAQASTSATFGKMIGQKRKTVSEEEPPNNQDAGCGVYQDRKRKDALPGVRKSKRLKH